MSDCDFLKGGGMISLLREFDSAGEGLRDNAQEEREREVGSSCHLEGNQLMPG